MDRYKKWLISLLKRYFSKKECKLHKCSLTQFESVELVFHLYIKRLFIQLENNEANYKKYFK